MYMELWETGESKLRLKWEELAKCLCLQIRENPQTEILLEKESGERSQGKRPVGCATVIKVIFPFLEYYI